MPRIKQAMPTDLYELAELGLQRINNFCNRNSIPCPTVDYVNKNDWPYEECAFYRPTYIRICLTACARPASELAVRNWNWPGSTTDRTPFGVLAHELGHHCDMLASKVKGKYSGDFSMNVKHWAGEAPLTSYCPNDAEWFAEHFRLFVTNAALLEQLRPKTYKKICEVYTPVSYKQDWEFELGLNAPDRIVANLAKKVMSISK